MVATAEAAGTRTVALLTDMGQPLGRAAGNWIELVESVELLRDQRPAESEDLRELSLVLAGWMIHLGGKAESAQAGRQLAEAALEDGSALAVFFKMIEAQGGDSSVFDGARSLPQPRRNASPRTHGRPATSAKWTRQKSAGPCSAPARAAKRPESLSIPTPASSSMPAAAPASEQGQPIATLYATASTLLPEPAALLREAIVISTRAPSPVKLVSRIFTRENAEAHLRHAVR